MKKFLVIAGFLGASLLPGCAELQVAKQAVADNDAKAADAELEVSEWGICNAATIGAWMRRYGNDPEKVEGWKRLCSKKVTEAPVPAK